MIEQQTEEEVFVLKIDCPRKLGLEFINLAKKEFGSKQYVALSHLIRNYEEMRLVSHLITDLREVQENLEFVMKELNELKEEKKKKEVSTEQFPSTFGEGGHP
jgi:hypothetical protein